MTSLKRRIWKWTAALVAAVLILLAVGVGLFRVAVPLVPGFKSDAETIAERAIGWPVHIGEMDLRWAWLGPELVLRDVQLLAPGTRQPLVTAMRIDIAFGPGDLFQDGALRPSHLRLHEPTLALERTADGRLVLSGYALPERQDARLDWRELMEFGLQHGRLTILDGELHYRDIERGISDWTLRLSNVSLASDGRNHEIEGALVPPGALGEEVAFRFDAQGAPGRPEAWNWSGALGVRGLRLAWWYRQFTWAGPGLLGGSLDLSAELSGRGIERVAGAGQLAVSNLHFTSREPAMQPPHESAATDLGSFATQWRLEHSADRTGVHVQDLALERDGRRYRGISLSAQAGEGEYPLQLAVGQLPLAELAAFASLLPEADASADHPGAAEILRHLQPRGELAELFLGIDTTAEPAQFRVQAEFEALGFNAWNALPGVDGLSGRLRGDRAEGTLWLDSQDVWVDAGDLFRGALPARRLAGEFGWRSDGDDWRVTGENIAVENPEASAEGAFTLELPDDAPAVLDMTAKVFDVDFQARSRWLPVGVMSDALVRWIDEGVLDGHAPEATVTLHGPVKNFPFRDGSGVFDVRFRAEDTVVEYAPGWPRVENLAADVHFHNAGVDVRVDRAHVMEGLSLSAATASIADFRDRMLHVNATTGGDTAAAWRFLQASPLATSLTGLLDNVSPTGPFDATVAIDVPFGKIEQLDLAVDADLNGARVDLGALPWDVESLRGRVRVTEDDVTAESLRGMFTGAPFAASIVSAPATAGETFAPVRIEAKGRSPVAAFGDYVPAAWLRRLDGGFDWQGDIAIAPGAPLRVNIDSSLAGVDSRLPAPLHETRPVRADIVVPDDEHIDASFTFDGLGAARLRFVDEPGGWRFDRGRVRFGAADTPSLPDTSGLSLQGRVELLASDAWLELDDETTGDGGGASSGLVKAFDLRADRVTFRRMTLANQGLAGRRSGAGWELALDGPVSGAIAIPSLQRTDQPWQIMLQTLHLPLPEAKKQEGPGEAPDPRELPGIVLDVRDFQVGPVHLGHVSGELQRTSIGYTAQQLTARAPSFDLTLDGRWEFIGGEHYTSIVGDLTTRDLADTLAGMGYRGGIDADDGSVRASIAWHDAPFAPDRAALEGNVSFEFRDGSLSEVRPGAGRLIGLLSLAALPRRLLLDFSDLFGEGLHFDTLAGDFLITGGNAYTTNVQLRGPSASALLVGRTGLVAQDYDQLAIIDPDVSASLPVAGYLAAGPSVGAALLLLSQLLKAPLADIAQVKYRITGSWENPVIERIGPSANEQQNAQTAN